MSKNIVIPENIITSVDGRAVPKTADKQNTDQILPKDFLLKTSFKEMGTFAYFSERHDDDGNLIMTHPFNDPQYSGASILLAGASYGCGSSREHAPQGLMRWGINGIVAVSYAGIFDGNCAAIGVVAATATPKQVEELADLVKQNPQLAFEMNVEDRVLRYDGKEMPIGIRDGVRQAFLEGTWDAIPVLMQYEDEIKAAEARIPYLHFK